MVPGSGSDQSLEAHNLRIGQEPEQPETKGGERWDQRLGRYDDQVLVGHDTVGLTPDQCLKQAATIGEI